MSRKLYELSQNDAVITPSEYNPTAKTAAMTQPVGVDANGALFTAPGGGGGSSGHKVVIANTMNDTTGSTIGAAIVRLYKTNGTYEDVTLNAASRGQEFSDVVWIDVVTPTNSSSCFNIVSYRLGAQDSAPYGFISSNNRPKSDGLSGIGCIIADGSIEGVEYPGCYAYSGLYPLSDNDNGTISNYGCFFKTLLLPCDTYLICQGGIGACLLKGTKVTLANREEKNIEDISYDDEILVWDFDNGCLTSAKPIWIKRGEIGTHYWRNEFASGRVVLTTGESYGHRFFDGEAGAFVPNTECKVSFNIDGKEDLLVKCERIDEPCEYYNVITQRHFNLFANGILSSTSLNNLYTIRGMKFDKSEAVKREYTGRAFGRGLVEGLRLAEQPRPISVTETYVNRLIERMV